MDVKKAIEKRRSIRRYKNKKISDDIIKELINAARLAPSGRNRQGARYKVIVDKETIQRLKQNKIYEQDFVYTAPLLIICCYDNNVYSQHIKAMRDVSIASSFIIIQATELKLGTCYVALMDTKKAKKILNLPENIEILFTITVGYTSEKIGSVNRKNINEILL